MLGLGVAGALSAAPQQPTESGAGAQSRATTQSSNASGSFFDAYRAERPGARPPERFLLLLQALVEELRSPKKPPPGFPVPGVVLAEMHASCPKRFLSFCDYYLAEYARVHGGPEDLGLAARNLEASSAEDAGFNDNSVRMAVFVADIYRGLGRYGSARRVLDKAEATARGKISNPAVLSNLHGLRGELARENGRLDDAHADTEKAIELAEGSKDANAILRAVNRSLELALSTGRFEEVRSRVDSLLATLGTEDPAVRSELLTCRGYAESGLARRDPSFLPVARTTLKRALEGMHTSALGKVLLKLCDLALRAGDVRDAEALLVRARPVVGVGQDLSSVSWTPDACDLVDLENRCCLAKESTLAELRVQRNRHVQALRGLCEQWSGQPPSRGGIGFLHMDSRRDLLGSGFDLALKLASAEGHDDGPARALDDLLRMQAMVSLARVRGAEVCTEADVRQRYLQPGQVALAYLPCHAKIHLFCIERERVRHATLASGQDVLPACQALVRELMGSPVLEGAALEAASERFAAAGRAAAALLIPQEFRSVVLGASGLTVVGADLLQGVPFEALLCEGDNLLGEVVPIDNLPSLPLGVRLAGLPGLGAPLSVAALVCTAPRPEVAVAAGVKPFALSPASIAAWFRDYRDPVVLVDEQVTRKGVRDLALDTVDVLHWVAHGAEDLAESGARDLVAFDGRIPTSDLEARPAPKLVLVSVCGAGVGPSRPGEGDLLASFAGTFLWKGALAVVASQNEIAALDHLAFLGAVHRHLAAGHPPAAALQRARAESAKGSGQALFSRAQRALMQVTGLGHKRRAGH